MDELIGGMIVESYRAGPTREWLKVKQRRESQFVVVGLDMPLA
jgi:hypothetical protein